MWLKNSDDYPEDCARAGLSDAAYRTHHEALCWVMRRENGGHISKRDVQRFAESDLADEAVEDLVACGFWRAVAGGYEVVFHLEHQPEPDVIQARREAAAERQRRHRRARLGLPDVGPSPHQSPRESRRDQTCDPGRVGSGRVGSGQLREEPPTKAGEPSPNEASYRIEPDRRVAGNAERCGNCGWDVPGCGCGAGP
jgi:hypothetical protein